MSSCDAHLQQRSTTNVRTAPDNLFDEVSIDFTSINEETLSLVVDDHGRFPLVEPISFASASVVISKLNKLLAMFGTPHLVKQTTDHHLIGNILPN